MKNKSKGKTYIIPARKKCHTGFCKIHEHLWVGSKYDLQEEILLNIEVIVSLSDLSGAIWERGYENEIIYFPIDDFQVLPEKIERMLVSQVLEQIINNKKNVAICCDGGHGRTGYIASLVLYELGISDPIEYLRKNYCDKAVETMEQLEAIACYTEKPELINKYKNTMCSFYNNPYSQSDYYKTLMLSSYGVKNDLKKEKTCEDCISHINYICEETGIIRYPNDAACEFYVPI